MSRWPRPHLAAALLGAVLLLAVAQGTTAAAGPVQVTVRLEPAILTVGDRARLEIVIEAPAAVDVSRPEIGSTLGIFELLETFPPQVRETGSGLRQTVWRFTVAAFDSGPTLVPAIEVPYTELGNEPRSTWSDPTPVSVESVLPQQGPLPDLRPLKPQMTLPGAPANPYVPAGVGLAAALALGSFVLLSRRRPAVRTEAPMDAAALDPEMAALAELDRIESLALPKTGDLATHYALMASCLRSYVRSRYGLPAEARTSRELAFELERAGVDGRQALMILEVLREGDAVRYGRMAPNHRRADRALHIARETFLLPLEPRP
ncbi:MAG: hypothetical protein HYY05_08640 [Chloroflexi bacterium]|nr:hypothetical protein [Chloroflexota bacterium]